MLMRSKGKQRANFPRRGKYRKAGIGVHFHGRSPVGMFSPRAKGAAFRFYYKRRPPIFQGAYHRCEAAYKICGKAATITLPPFGTAYHLSTRTSVGRQKESVSIFSCPLEGNAAKRQRVYGGKNDDVALILPYAAPYFARLAHPMQDVHSGQQGVLELGP